MSAAAAADDLDDVLVSAASDDLDGVLESAAAAADRGGEAERPIAA